MLSIIQQTEQIDEWYRATATYKHRTHEQQIAAYYQTLGDIAGAVLGMDNLKMASAIGRSIWTFVGLLHYGEHTNVGDFVVPLDAEIKIRERGLAKEFVLPNLFAAASEVVQLITGPDFNSHSYGIELRTLAKQYRFQARICGLEFDRVVANGQQQMITSRTRQSKYSGGMLHGAILNMLTSRTTELQCVHFREAIEPLMLSEIEKKLNVTLNEFLDLHIRRHPTRRVMLFTRQPAVVLCLENETINIVINDDLKAVMTLLLEE